MKNVRVFLVAGIFVTFLVFRGTGVFGDTVITHDRERVMGVIVEEYRDRVVISTSEGEREIMRSDIRDMRYDDEEQNLTRLGNMYQDRGRYQEAYYYYSQALEINPDHAPAREGLDYSGMKIQQRGLRMKMDHIERMNEERAWRTGVQMSPRSMEQQLRETLGFSVVPYGANFRITDVRLGSPAREAGLIDGDVIIAAWGRLVGYTRPEEFMAKVISPDVMEVRITIERKIDLAVKEVRGRIESLLDARVRYSETEGFEIEEITPGGTTDQAGMIEGDILSEIEGVSTRYMPIKDLEAKILEKRGDKVDLKIRRDVSLWKRLDR